MRITQKLLNEAKEFGTKKGDIIYRFLNSGVSKKYFGFIVENLIDKNKIVFTPIAEKLYSEQFIEAISVNNYDIVRSMAPYFPNVVLETWTTWANLKTLKILYEVNSVIVQSNFYIFLNRSINLSEIDILDFVLEIISIEDLQNYLVDIFNNTFSSCIKLDVYKTLLFKHYNCFDKVKFLSPDNIDIINLFRSYSYGNKIFIIDIELIENNIKYFIEAHQELCLEQKLTNILTCFPESIMMIVALDSCCPNYLIDPYFWIDYPDFGRWYVKDNLDKIISKYSEEVKNMILKSYK